MGIPAEFVAEVNYRRDAQFTDSEPPEQIVLGRSARRGAGPVGAFRAWPQVQRQLSAADAIAIFLDFDGTLVGLKRRPEQVRLAPEVRRLLRRIARHKNVTLVIASGRRVRDLKRLIGLKQLRYFGVHGAENEARALSIPAKTRAALRDAHSAITAAAARLAGVWIEPKGVTFAVHYRGARRPAIERIQRTLSRVVDKNILRILKGKGAWEVLPREIVGKSTIIEEIVARCRIAPPWCT